jgi:hypothetical protein
MCSSGESYMYDSHGGPHAARQPQAHAPEGSWHMCQLNSIHGTMCRASLRIDGIQHGPI